jgi:hypothetical protein
MEDVLFQGERASWYVHGLTGLDPFSDIATIDLFHVNRQSAYLIGRDRIVSLPLYISTAMY